MVRMTLAVGLVVALAGASADQTSAAQDALLIRLAIELAVDRDAAPIALGPDRQSQHGLAYDRFTKAHLAARVAFLRGKPFDPLKPPGNLLGGQLVVVAVPLICGDRLVSPADVDVFNRASPVPKWLPAAGPAIQKVLPGADVPAGAIAVQFSAASLREGQVVRISYAGAVCNGTSRQISLPVSATVPRGLERPEVEMPPNEPAPPGPITLNISGVVDLDGRLRYATAPEATTPFGAAALTAARRMRFDPARINGSPTPWTAGVILTFGVPAPAPVATEQSTPDVAGLTAGSSKCQVSEDATYGTFATNAIKIGGGVDGAARMQQFLNVLRGPTGQGLQYQSTGPVLMRGQGGVLEAVEVRHAGLSQPVRLYFDTAREGPVMAPKGFTCAR